MNKKFSTLVASLLFASTFSAFAGTAAPMFTAPNGVETRALVPGKDAQKGTNTALDALGNRLRGHFKGFTNNARLHVYQAADGVGTGENWFVVSSGLVGTEADYAGAAASESVPPFYFTLDGDKLVGGNNIVLSLAGEQNFDIVPLTKQNGTPTSFFALRVAGGTKKGKYITFTKGSGVAGTFVANGDAATAAAIFASFETAYTIAATGTDLNNELSNGFNLSVSSGAATLKDAELFSGKLTAMNLSAGAFEPAKTQTAVYLKNKDGKYLVFDQSLNKTNTVVGGFKLVSEAEAKELTAPARAIFTIKTADNGGKTVEVTVDTDKRLFVNISNGTGVLTAVTARDLGLANAESWAITSLGVSNQVDFKTFLTGKFVKVSFVKGATTSEANAVAYKINGILGLRYNATANAVKSDYIKSSSVVTEDPATMWAPSIASGGDLVLTNRENKDMIVTIKALRDLNGRIYQIEGLGTTADGLLPGEQIKIEFVNSVTKTDGYMVAADNVLKNTTYYLGQSRRNADGDIPAYWAENHASTHQIGATVNLEEATRWNVRLIKKSHAAYSTQTDSVLVVSRLNAYNTTTGITTEIADTLAVLPYVFQNRGNREYVKLNNATNLQYYICDADNKTFPRGAQVFALKKKPGNTYNYFTMDEPVGTYFRGGSVSPINKISGANKVYLKNSESKGAWENIAAYADDANSLMVVEPIDAPEYRKVATWGDTVKIYRQEYPTEVLFEKRDAKSVVDKDTLSFLNVNNSVSGANPALFVDTAFVNRTVGGVANTCYQYLLAVNVDKNNSYYCPHNKEHNSQAWRDQHNGGKPCADAMNNVAVKGRFLINLIDVAYAYKLSHPHNNPYINMVEAGENLAKLSFVEGVHVKDTLFITRKSGEVIKLQMNDPAFNVAKFAFRYVDNNAGSFKIQTQYKDYNTANRGESSEGYLRWVNGTVVVTKNYSNGEVFNMEENFKGNPVANETIGTSSISVVATNGAVIIKGAAGKKVTISNVLGQTVSNTVISSDKAEISAPAGVVIVAVEGEAAVKAIVK